MKLLSYIQDWLEWLKKSFQEDSGKTSGKSLSAAFFSFLIAYIVVYGVKQKDLSPTTSDFIIWIVIALLGYIAAAFGMKYIPKKNNKPKEEEVK